MINFEKLTDKALASHPDADTGLLRKAYDFSAKEHAGQTRRSGEPYVTHPLEVASLVADMRLDDVAIAAGLLHDVVEDTLTSIERVRELFGPDVAHVVEGGLPRSARSRFRRARSVRRRTSARCCLPWSTTSG